VDKVIAFKTVCSFFGPPCRARVWGRLPHSIMDEIQKVTIYEFKTVEPKQAHREC